MLKKGKKQSAKQSEKNKKNLGDWRVWNGVESIMIQSSSNMEKAMWQTEQEISCEVSNSVEIVEVE